MRTTSAVIADEAAQPAVDAGAGLPRRLLWPLGAGLLLRWGLAILTEFHPIFPEYYYTDALLTDRLARGLAEVWSSGSGRIPNIEPSWRIFTALVGGTYCLAGPVPLLPKLLNGLAAMAAVCLWARLAFLCVGGRAATLVAWMLAL